MEIERWLDFYNEIIEEFGFSKAEDMESALLLNSFLERQELKKLEELIRGREVNIFGGGPSLNNLRSTPGGVNIAADGACSFLLERGVVPDVVVTDLDGNIADQLAANKKGAVIILHAHGDNIGQIKKYAESFTGVYGTTQTEPFGNLLNFGGFTDGDRAGFIAEHFKPKQVTFFGMDFEAPPGRYSFTKNDGRKRKKLVWAKRLVEYLMENSEVEITLV